MTYKFSQFHDALQLAGTTECCPDMNTDKRTHTHTHTHALAGGAVGLMKAEHCLLRKNDASGALDEMMRELQSASSPEMSCFH